MNVLRRTNEIAVVTERTTQIATCGKNGACGFSREIEKRQLLKTDDLNVTSLL